MSGGSVKRDGAGWMFVVDVPGAGGRRRQVRRRGFATKKEAQEELTRLGGDLQRGTFIARTRTTVEDYLTAWLDGLPAGGRRPSTVSSYRLLLRRSVLPTIGHIELQALRATDLDGLYSQLLERGLSASTVRKAHVVLGKAFSDAERKELLVRNPTRSQLRRRRQQRGRRRCGTGRRPNSGRSCPRSGRTTSTGSSEPRR